jgi:hypothetical protein
MSCCAVLNFHIRSYNQFRETLFSVSTVVTCLLHRKCVSRLLLSSTSRMEAAGTCETLVPVCGATLRHIPEDR